MRENVEENEYYDLYEVIEEDAARASNPRRSTRRGARAVSIESFYDEVVEEDTDNQDGVGVNSSAMMESGDVAREGNGNMSNNHVVESYYVLHH